MASNPNVEASFDPDLYLQNNPDVAEAGLDPREHWLSLGRDQERRGMRPSYLAPVFAEQEYLRHYPDVAELVLAGDYASGAEHWFVVGRDEVKRGRRKPFPDFDESDYRARRIDIAAHIDAGVYISGFDHWLIWGNREDDYHRERLTTLIQRATDAPSVHFASRAYEDNLSAEMSAFWQTNGFLILEGAISADRCAAMNDRIDRLWVERRETGAANAVDIFIGEAGEARVAMRDAPGEARARPHKIHDMAKLDARFCDVALDDAVADVLRSLLNSDPVVTNCWNLERGSTSRLHTDTLRMSASSKGGLVAAWFALEDVTEAAGPLLYYPGSHRIPAFRFTNGAPLAIVDEMPDYDTYMSWHLAKLGLAPAIFLPKRGDVLFWHEQLYHGGAPIIDMAQTRKSMICHYRRADECPAGDLIAKGKGFYETNLI